MVRVVLRAVEPHVLHNLTIGVCTSRDRVPVQRRSKVLIMKVVRMTY